MEDEMNIEKAKELILSRAKDMGLEFDPEDLEVSSTKNSTLIWLTYVGDRGNVIGEQVDDTEVTWYLRFPQLAFILWDDGTVCDKVGSISFENTYEY